MKKKKKKLELQSLVFSLKITDCICCCITEIALIEAVETLRKAVVDVLLGRDVTVHLDCNTSVLHHSAFIISVM